MTTRQATTSKVLGEMMNLQVPGECEDFVRNAVRSGRFKDAEDVIRQALQLLEKNQNPTAQQQESGGQSEQAEMTVDSDQAATPGTSGGWTKAKNARRFALIDKQIQQQLTADEQTELNRLTEEMCAAIDTEENVPLDGARRLHAELLKKKAHSQSE